MLFNSLLFPIFFALVYLAFRAVPRTDRNVILLLASYLFYGLWDPAFLALIGGITAVAFVSGQLLKNKRWSGRRAVLILAVVFHLGVLFVFKYLGFFVEELHELLGAVGLAANDRPPGLLLSLMLPVGLSFYVLQSLGYVIDVHRGKVDAETRPLEFALFVAFFPQLVAGPIERASHLLPQFKTPREVTRSDLADGAYLVLWGYFKKLFVADNLSVVVTRTFEAEGPIGGFAVAVATVAFTWQLYCDFSGYTDIARGLARMMGVHLSHNFRIPLLSASPRELWRRWHITLSQWLRDYLYIPLGGDRRGAKRTAFNLMVTMALGGLWHGAEWTFVVWGLVHGCALVFQRMLGFQSPRGIARVPAMLAMFTFTCLAFLIFRAHDLQHAWTLLSAMAAAPLPRPGDGVAVIQLTVLVALPLGLEILQYWKGVEGDVVLRLSASLRAVLAVVMVFGIVVLGGTLGQQFIYFRF